MKSIFATSVMLAATGAVSLSANAGLVYENDFSATDPDVAFNLEAGDPASWDEPNDQVDYAHTAGTTRRYVNHNNGTIAFTSLEGYIKAEISNFTGASSIWLGFIEDNVANNGNYAQTSIDQNGVFELVVNNSNASIGYDNGAGWSGTLAAGTGLATTDGGATTEALVFGAAVDLGIALKGFGLANFGNGTVFPTSSFSVDSILVHDSATVPEPASLALLGLGSLAVLGHRRAQA